MISLHFLISTTPYQKDMYKEESIEANSTIHFRTHLWDSTVETRHPAKLSFCEMKYQMILAKIPSGWSYKRNSWGDIKPGDITFYRQQSTADNKLRAYIAHGEVLPVATRSFRAIGVFAIPEMGRFYRHVLIEGRLPTSRSCNIRTSRKSSLRGIQIHRCTGWGDLTTTSRQA